MPLIVISARPSSFILDTEWVVANQELCGRQGYTVRGLPVGEKINFRVVAVNIAGRSPPATLQQPVTIHEITGKSFHSASRHEPKRFVFVVLFCHL